MAEQRRIAKNFTPSLQRALSVHRVPDCSVLGTAVSAIPREAMRIYRSLLALATASGLILTPAVGTAAPPGPKKGPKAAPKKAHPPATPAPVAPPPAPPAAEVQQREDPNAKTAEQLEKERAEAAEASKEKATSFGGLLGLNIPVGPYAGVSGLGFGGYIDFEHHFISAVALGVRVGFQGHLDGKTTRNVNGIPHSVAGRAHVLPIAVSARIYPVRDTGAGAPYFLLEPGIFVRLVSEDDTNPTTNAVVSNSATKANFGLGLGAGYTIKGFDARLMFHTYDVTKADVRMALGLFLGYRFASF